MLTADHTQRFLFEDFDVRGEWASLEHSYAEVLARHPYPEPVAILLGELLAAAALLTGTLKFEGTLTLQARAEGAVPLLMVECSNKREVRGVARYHAEQLPEGRAALKELMPKGVLAITLDPEKGQRYQGIVSLEAETLAVCLSDYFASSEQLSTRFWLESDGRRACGFLLQQLPPQQEPDAEARAARWQHLNVLADTLTREELLTLPAEQLLHRLYHDEQVRLFDPQPLVFSCSCSRERSANALSSLGEADAMQLMTEQGGQISIDCQFCNRRYLFDAADVAQLFAGGGAQEPASTRH